MKLRVVSANLVVRLKSFYRERTTMFFTVAFPILLILVFGTIFLDRDKLSLDLYVQDLDHTRTSAQFVKTLQLDGNFKIIEVDTSSNAREYAKKHRLNLILIIPKGFEKLFNQRLDLKAPNASAILTYVYDPSSTAVKSKMEYLNMELAGMNQKMSGKPPFYRWEEISILNRKYTFIEFFIPGVIAMAVMTASLFGTVNLNTELLQKGITRKLATTPITRADWVLSNILYQFILAIISTTAMLLVSYGVFHIDLQINFWLLVFILLDAFAFVGIGIILTRFVQESQSAAAAANAIVFPMMFLSGSFFPIEMMPGFLQTFAKLLPLYYVNEGLRASMIFGDNLAALRDAAIIGVFAAVVFAWGIIAIKWEEAK
jgi:ABC-2 type transport system permease protein